MPKRTKSDGSPEKGVTTALPLRRRAHEVPKVADLPNVHHRRRGHAVTQQPRAALRRDGDREGDVCRPRVHGEVVVALDARPRVVRRDGQHLARAARRAPVVVVARRVRGVGADVQVGVARRRHHVDLEGADGVGHVEGEVGVVAGVLQLDLLLDAVAQPDRPLLRGIGRRHEQVVRRGERAAHADVRQARQPAVRLHLGGRDVHCVAVGDRVAAVDRLAARLPVGDKLRVPLGRPLGVEGDVQVGVAGVERERDGDALLGAVDVEAVVLYASSSTSCASSGTLDCSVIIASSIDTS